MRIMQACLPTLIVLLLVENAIAQPSPTLPPTPTPTTQPASGNPPAAVDLSNIAAPLKLVSLTILLVEGPTSKLPADEPPEKLLPLIDKLARDNELTAFTRLQLATADGQSGFVQNGEQVNVAQGDARVVGGRVTSRVITRMSIGTMVRCTPRIIDGAIVALLEIEESRLVPFARPMDAPEEAPADLPPTMQTAVSRSVVTIPTGRTVLIGSQQTTTPDGKSRQSLILVTAKIVE